MNKQTTWRSTLIEACGAQLMILAVAAALTLLHVSPARAETADVQPPGIHVVEASDELRALPDTSVGGRPPLGESSIRKNFVTCFQIDIEFLDRFERTRRRFFLNP